MLFDDLIEQYLLVMTLLISNAIRSQSLGPCGNRFEDLTLRWRSGALWTRFKRVIATSVITNYPDVALR